MAHPKPGNDTPGTVTPGSRNSTTPRDLPFPHPSENIASTLRTLITLLFRGNAVLDERTPTFKDEELLAQFGRGLVAAQFPRP